MAYENIKTTINNIITSNGNNEITGADLNTVLDAIVDTFAGYQYGGLITPASTFTLDADLKWFFLANENGTYTNFNEIVLENELAVILYDGDLFTKDTIMSTANALVVASNSEMESATNDTKFVSPLKWIYGFVYHVANYLFYDLKTTAKSIIGSINELFYLKAMQNPGMCQTCPLIPDDIEIDPVTNLTLSIVTRGGNTINASNPIRFYTDGGGVVVKHEKTTVQTVSFTNTTGYWYFYFDSNGDLIATQTDWSDFNIIAPVYRFYWNATLSGANRLVEEIIEYHPNDIPASDHSWKHINNGSIWVSGGNITHNAISVGTPNVDGRNTCISLSTVTCEDDNLFWTVTNNVTNGLFRQDLGHLTAGTLTSSNSGIFNIKNHDSSGRLFFTTGTRFPFPFNSGNNKPQYITANGTMTDVTNNYFFVIYVYTVGNRIFGKGVKLVTAETDFSTITAARSHDYKTVKNLYSSLQDPEKRPLYKLIFEYKSTFDVAIKYSCLREYVDIRQTPVASPVNTIGGSINATNVITLAKSVLTSTNVESTLQQINDTFVVGPASATDNSIAIFNGITGKLLKDASGVYIVSGNTGMGTTNPIAKLDVSSGNIALVLGADSLLDTRTDNTIKYSRMGSANYVNAEEPFSLISGISNASNNEVSIGGGTGLLNSATILRFYTGNYNTTTGTQRMIINSSGNIGISVDAPFAKLHASRAGTPLTTSNWTPNARTVAVFDNDSSGCSTITVAGRSTGQSELWFGDESAEFQGRVRYDHTNDSLQLWSNAAERLRITSTGNVGIGSGSYTLQQGKLDVSNGSIALVVGADALADTKTDATAKAGRICMPHYTNAEEPVMLIHGGTNATENNIFIGGGTSLANAATRITFHTAANSTTTGGTERMRIDSAGNVGIGTNNPTEKLHVIGNIAVSGTVDGRDVSEDGLKLDSAIEISTGIVIKSFAKSLDISSTSNSVTLFTVPSSKIAFMGYDDPSIIIHFQGSLGSNGAVIRLTYQGHAGGTITQDITLDTVASTPYYNILTIAAIPKIIGTGAVTVSVVTAASGIVIIKGQVTW